MFKKPFEIKHNTQLKKSSKKQFLMDILKTFPALTNDKLSEFIPKKENVFCIRISTHCDKVVDVYCVQKISLVFKLENRFYPSIYFLWKVPDLIPSFITHPVVFNFISNGADLMLPGVIVAQPITPISYGNLEKGSIVCVTFENNRATAMAVGVTALSSSDMFMSNKRGKCVSILHFYGDHLSRLDALLPVPIIWPEPGLHEQICEATEILNMTASDKATENDLDSGNDDILTETTNQDESTNLNSNNILNGQLDQLFLPESEITQAEMDELLMYCFLQSVKTSAKNVKLPLLTSNLFKNHILAACPEDKTLELKKTKYKKLSNFLKEMEESGLIKSQTVSKGVSVISSINYDHEALKTFENTYSNIENKQKTEDDQKATLRGEEMYSVSSATLPLFELYLYKKQDMIDKERIQKCLQDYVERKNLVDQYDKKYVIQDDLLKNITGKSMTLSWPQLIEAITKKLENSLFLNTVNKTIVKGKQLSPIDIQVGTRNCNKKVTLVNNLEFYGINLKEFCQECQHGVAASTTINHPPSSKSAQVQVQGNQVDFVSKLLMNKYKIPVNMIRGLENIKKKKKIDD